MITTEMIIRKLTSLPPGKGWKLLIWKDGLATILGDGYPGEKQFLLNHYDGVEPLIILERDKYEKKLDKSDTKLYNTIETLILEALSKHKKR